MSRDFKNLIKILILFSWVALFTPFSFAQTANKNLIEKVDLYFSLAGKPTAAKVGFDNPASYWKLEYELVLTDSFVLEKQGRCHRTETYRLYCPLNKDKKLDKTIRKTSIRIVKGEFIKQGPLPDPEFEVKVPVQLSAEVIDIFNKAALSDSNPTFVLFVKTKAFTKTADKIKFKSKFTTSGVHPLKFYKIDKTFDDYWNITRLGLALDLERGEDGKIRGFGIYRY